MKNTALIMAGGRGERFWPRSRKDLPKQFLSLTGDGKTMIQLTVERILPIVAMEDIYIATNKSYEALVKEQLPGIPAENILCEPAGRNTAPCIGIDIFLRLCLFTQTVPILHRCICVFISRPILLFIKFLYTLSLFLCHSSTG